MGKGMDQGRGKGNGAKAWEREGRRAKDIRYGYGKRARDKVWDKGMEYVAWVWDEGMGKGYVASACGPLVLSLIMVQCLTFLSTYSHLSH